MTEPRIAQRGPYEVAAEGGRKYAWCACGRSATQPLCDGSHKDTGLSPLVTVAPRSETLYFCGCKQAKDGILCDGTHKGL